MPLTCFYAPSVTVTLPVTSWMSNPRRVARTGAEIRGARAGSADRRPFSGTISPAISYRGNFSRHGCTLKRVLGHRHGAIHHFAVAQRDRRSAEADRKAWWGPEAGDLPT